MSKMAHFSAGTFVLAGLATLVTLYCCSGARGGQGARGPGGQAATAPATDPGPPPARAELSLDKQEYFLGENVLLHWSLTNTSDEPLEISVGGDYRTNARRPLRFVVIATDAEGRQVEDPCPNPYGMGGIGTSPRLKPGEVYWTSLVLMRHCDFRKPGTYKLRVYHDLGWDKRGPAEHKNVLPDGPHRAPIAETTIKLAQPTPAQARQVVEHMLAMPPDPGHTFGQRRGDFPDFTALRQPVYLPIVAELARKGDARGPEALGAMLTPQATRTLVELLGHKDKTVADKAMDLLLERLPDPGIGRGPYDEGRRRLVQRSWCDDMRPGVLAVAWKLLARDDRQSLIRGGGILKALGGKEDLGRLIKVLDRVLPAMKDDPVEQRAYPRPVHACGALVGAGWALIDRGAEPPRDSSSPGRAALFMTAVGRRKDFRPDGWRAAAIQCLRHEIPYVRAVAVANLPVPLDEGLVEPLVERVEDAYPPVQMGACDLAAKVESPRFAAPVTRVLQAATDEWIVPAAYRAALACGVPRDEVVGICIRRLTEQGMCQIMFNRLIELVHTEGGWGCSQVAWGAAAPVLQQRWLAFLQANRQAIRRGVQFRIGQRPLRADLFPRGLQFHRPSQPPWPPQPSGEAAKAPVLPPDPPDAGAQRGSRGEAASAPAATQPAAAPPRLKTAPSPYKLLASGVKYAGVPHQGYISGVSGAKVTVDGVAYYRPHVPDVLVAQDTRTGAVTEFPMFDLAIAAGWYARKDGGYLPHSIRGLFRQDGRLWMGTNGVGVIVYDTKARTWSRHDIKATPVPGHHATVLHGDAEFVFASHGWHQGIAQSEPSLHVFSVRQGRWLRITAIPSKDALRLGHSEGLTVSAGWNHRRYAEQDCVPIGGSATPGLSHPRELTRRPDGSYLLRSGHPDKESSLTELVVRPADLRAAFEEAAGNTPKTQPVAPAQRAAALCPSTSSSLSVVSVLCGWLLPFLLPAPW